LTGCGSGQYTLSELQPVLDKKKANTAESPYTVAIAPINIAANVPELNTIIEKAGKFVILDLSACASSTNTVPKMEGLSGYIKGLILPPAFTAIGDESFAGCASLTSITIPGSVTKIGERAFKDCTGLTSVTISKGVTEIGDDAFDNCSALTSITIPASVTKLTENEFDGCKGLQKLPLTRKMQHSPV
jgi:hypothetical protein